MNSIVKEGLFDKDHDVVIEVVYEELKSRLHKKLHRLVKELDKLETDKKEIASSYATKIKQTKHMILVLSTVIENNDYDLLTKAFNQSQIDELVK